MNKLYLLSLLFFLGVQSALAQNTVGLLSYNPSQTYDGYNLLYPHNQPNVYLLDNCGEIVHVWTDEADFRPGNTAYLLENGNLVKAKRPAAVAGDAIWAGGGGAIIEIRSWENELLWSYELNNDTARLHHDFAITDEGTLLLLAWELKTEEEAIQAGRNPELLVDGELWPDYIFEIDPNTDEILWEWHTWDHLIQDFDDSKDNYGVVEDHPERVDINFVFADGVADWMHSNAMDYEPVSKQIILSVPTFSEVWIIDHTTTTEEAAGSFGGLGNRGGDLMYRWGNPQAYRAGDESDQTLFYQHDIHWIDDFLNPAHPDYGKLAVFNNRRPGEISSAHVIEPVFDMYEWVYPMQDGKWTPAGYDKTFDHPDPSSIYSTGLSSVQLLPNENVLICSGRHGYSFEMNPDGEIVWEYTTPLIGGSPATQGDSLELNQNLTFRIKRYPADYPAFEGKELNSQGWLELDPNTTFCQQILPTSETRMEYDLEVFPNPASGRLVIEWKAGVYADIHILDIHGRPVYHFNASGGRRHIDVSAWVPGVYLIQVDGQMSKRVVVR
jgi:hypothetical protein